jgi:hypothetical protein
MTDRKPAGPVKPDYRSPDGTTDAKSLPDLPPLQPQPVLFVVLGIVLLLWLGALVLMRMKTVNRPVIAPAATQPLTR